MPRLSVATLAFAIASSSVWDVSGQQGTVTTLPVGMQVGLTFTCSFNPRDEERCASLVSGSLDPPGLLLAARSSIGNGADMTSLEVSTKLRGFDNQMEDGADGFQWVNWTQEHSCFAINGSLLDHCILGYHIQVQSAGSVPWEPPTKVVVPCAVQGQTQELRVNFTHADVKDPTRCRPLRGSWRRGPELPWVDSSRPSGVRKKTPGWVHNYDAGSQQILRSIEAEGDSLRLELQPPEGSDGATWQVCFFPADGYNTYTEICLEEFPVYATMGDCPQPRKGDDGTVSGALMQSLLHVAALILAVTCLLLF